MRENRLRWYKLVQRQLIDFVVDKLNQLELEV